MCRTKTISILWYHPNPVLQQINARPVSFPLFSSYPISLSTSVANGTEAECLHQTKIRRLSSVILLSFHLHSFHLIALVLGLVLGLVLALVLALGITLGITLLLLNLGRCRRPVRSGRWEGCAGYCVGCWKKRLSSVSCKLYWQHVGI